MGREPGLLQLQVQVVIKSMLWVQSCGTNCFFGESREKQDWHPTNRQRQHGKDGVWLGLRELTPGSDSDSESDPPARQRVLRPAGPT